MNVTPTRIFELAEYTHQNFNKKDVLAGKENGVWRKYSAEEYVNTSNSIGYGLLNLGIERGDKIAIVSANRPEWNLTDMGINKIGAINVPIYPNITTADYEYILNDAGVKILFVGSEEIFDKVHMLIDKVETLEAIYSYDDIQNAKNWNEIIEDGKSNPQASKMKANQLEVKSSDLLTLIYTSGTTGNPKGVMLSHDNLYSQFVGLKDAVPFDESDRAISFLPLCHVFERIIEYYYLFKGTSIYYAESLEQIGENLKEINPTIMPTVPRLLEKVYDKIVAKGSDLTGVKKGLFFWALNLGLRHELDGKNGWWYEFQLKIANKLIFKKWREAVGGNIKYIVSGAAALQPRLARVFTAAQMPIYEGYGLSETSPVISVNTTEPGGKCYGTVGKVMTGVEVKFGDDGEILCRGHNVMMGYYNKPELTAEVIDDEGWFSTGDIGTMIDGIYLKITDRKKEIFKTSGRKYIAPQVMENKFKESRLIEQIMVLGEGEKMPGAFIVADFQALKVWCKLHQIDYTSDAQMTEHPDVLKKYDEEISHYNEQFAPYERIKKFVLMKEAWSVDGGELTATMKLKRKPVLSKYEQEYKEIYS
ncbi:MAG: AMP-dependent synthetase/ligase [Flavobacteriales bacterium]|nr:AMP-dependent synthetase/ligase [Flavobacteriales bacterium]